MLRHVVPRHAQVRHRRAAAPQHPRLLLRRQRDRRAVAAAALVLLGVLLVRSGTNVPASRPVARLSLDSGPESAVESWWPEKYGDKAPRDGTEWMVARLLT